MQSLLDWFAVHARDLPWRRTSDAYAIWISEIMLQQTQVKTVIPYWERWMHRFPDVRSLAEADQSDVLKSWEGLGYYSRARNAQKAAQVVVQHYGGIFPRSLEDVLSLPGIGRYTAGAICSIAYNDPAPILDGNVIRVLTRVFGIAENAREKETQERLWQLAETLVATAVKYQAEHPQCCSHLNQSLMELGALICTPRQPRCLTCPIATVCHARKEQNAEAYPNLGPRTATTSRRFAAFVVNRGDAFLVRQRPAGVVNGGLWEFPNIETTAQGTELADAVEQLFGIRPTHLERLHQIRHTITRYRIQLDVFRVEIQSRRKITAEGTWHDLEQLEKLAFPSAHRKILRVLARG